MERKSGWAGLLKTGALICPGVAPVLHPLTILLTSPRLPVVPPPCSVLRVLLRSRLRAGLLLLAALTGLTLAAQSATVLCWVASCVLLLDDARLAGHYATLHGFVLRLLMPGAGPEDAAAAGAGAGGAAGAGGTAGTVPEALVLLLAYGAVGLVSVAALQALSLVSSSALQREHWWVVLLTGLWWDVGRQGRR